MKQTKNNKLEIRQPQKSTTSSQLSNNKTSTKQYKQHYIEEQSSEQQKQTNQHKFDRQNNLQDGNQPIQEEHQQVEIIPQKGFKAINIQENQLNQKDKIEIFHRSSQQLDKKKQPAFTSTLSQQNAKDSLKTIMTIPNTTNDDFSNQTAIKSNGLSQNDSNQSSKYRNEQNLIQMSKQAKGIQKNNDTQIKNNNGDYQSNQFYFGQNKYQFFVVFDEKIIDSILTFLQLDDLVKFATLSQKARNKLLDIIKKQEDIYRKYENINLCAIENYGTCNLIFKLNYKYEKLLKSKLPQIQQELIEFFNKKNKNKNILLDILLSSINQFNKITLYKYDIINYIQTQGIEKAFRGLSKGYITPLKSNEKKLFIKDFPSDTNDNSLTRLIKLCYDYMKILQTITIPISKQKKGVKELKNNHDCFQFKILKQKLLVKFSRPIKCVNRTSNIFDYLNKNTIQLIIPFLDEKDISLLFTSSRKMQGLIKFCLSNFIEKFQSQRKQLLIENNLSIKEAQLAMYLMHFRVVEDNMELCELIFEKKDITYLDEYFEEKGIQKQLPQIEQQQNYQRNKTTFLDEFLQKYPDSVADNPLSKFIGTNKQFSNPEKLEIAALQKYIKGIKMFNDLKLNKSTLDRIEQIYIKKIFNIDKSLYLCEKFLKPYFEKNVVFTKKCIYSQNNYDYQYNIDSDFCYKCQVFQLKQFRYSFSQLIKWYDNLQKDLI